MSPSIAVIIRSMDRATLDQALQSIADQCLERVTAVVVAACGAHHRPLPEHYVSASASRCTVAVRLCRGDARLDRAAAANAGLKAAAGADLIGFLDDDDAMLPGHLRAMAAALEQTPAAALAFGRTLVRGASGEPLGEMGEPADAITLLGPPPFHTNAALFRRELLDRGVRFDDGFAIGEDVDFWMQCAQHTAFTFVDRLSTVWNAELGTSGAGAGTNADAGKMMAASARIHEKWMLPVFAAQNDWRRRFQIIRIALEHERFPLAEIMLDEAARQRPEDPNTWMFAGALAKRTGRLTLAITHYQRALAIVPSAKQLMDELAILRKLQSQAGR